MAANPDVLSAQAPGPDEVLALLRRVSAETIELRERLAALSADVLAASQRLETLCAPPAAPRLAAVSDVAAAPAGTPTPPPGFHVAVEMAVAGVTREQAHRRLAGDFAIADPTGILDEVYGAA